MSIPFGYDSSTAASAHTALTLVRILTKSPTVLLYVGPDQIMPLTSVLGAAVGIALMFWNRLVNLTVRAWSAITRRGQAPRAGSPDSAA